jgi:hypothetical protein
METDLKGAYFRKLRMLHCSELQLISFYSEAAARSGDHGVEALTDYSRDRRNLLENLAETHGISISGDDCQSMRRLIAASRSKMTQNCDSCSDLAEDICESVHRLQILNYSVARSLAAKLGAKDDLVHLDQALNGLLECFPMATESVIPSGMTGELVLARPH